MEFRAFIEQAKRSGYASGETERVTVLDDGANRCSFRTDDLEYIDTRYGFDPFSGYEIVRENGTAIWVMHYTGRTNQNASEAETLYRFLRRALEFPDPDMPLRGPPELKEGKYIYRNQVQGDLSYFSGNETISIDTDQVYSLEYHGVSIPD